MCLELQQASRKKTKCAPILLAASALCMGFGLCKDYYDLFYCINFSVQMHLVEWGRF